MDGSLVELMSGETTNGGNQSFRFVDRRNRMSSVKTYRIQTIVPASTTPAPISDDAGENRSLQSDPLSAKLPIFMTALRPAATARRRSPQPPSI